MKTTACDETRTLKSIDQADNLSAEASNGRANATRHHVLAPMQLVSLWVQRSGGAAIVVVQTAEHGESDDLARLRRLYLRWHRNTLADALVRSDMVEVAGVLPDDFCQMALIEDEHVVKALSVKTSEKLSQKEFALGAWKGVRMTSIPESAATAVK